MENRQRDKLRLLMTSSRKQALDSCTDVLLAERANKYFEDNRTMPGEKEIKDIARAQYGAMTQYAALTSDGNDYPDWEWNRNVPDRYVIDRDEFTTAMSNIVVKEVELHGKASYPTPTKEGQPGLRNALAFEAPIDTEKRSSTYQYEGELCGEGTHQWLLFRLDDDTSVWYTANIPTGFAANHPEMNGCKGTITIMDVTKNLDTRMGLNIQVAVDLMQEKGTWLTLDTSKEDDFARAVADISEPSVNAQMFR